MNKAPERSPYETVLALCLAFLIAYLVFEISWAVYASFGLGLIALLSQSIARLIHRLWLWISHWLGAIMTPVLLFLVFYVFLWPIALLYRLFGKGGMKKPIAPDSNYVIRDKIYTGKDLENMW